MRYTLDSSTAFKWYVAEPDADKALRIRDDARAGTFNVASTRCP
jgi:hypothetical protein